MVRREVLSWLKEAQADLGRSVRALEDGDYALSAFMSHQACEKALKALYLAVAKRLYPKTHDLTVLYEGIKEHLRLPEEVVELLTEVSQYYVTARYPNAGLETPSESFSRTQAVRALEVAKRVVSAVEEQVGGAGDPE